MKIKFIIILLFCFTLTTSSYGAASSGDGGKVKTSYEKGAYIIKKAKRSEKKGKTKKAIKQYEKALKYLIKSNEKKPNQADTLNYLGFTTRKLGDYENGEKYYLQGLAIEPAQAAKWLSKIPLSGSHQDLGDELRWWSHLQRLSLIHI